MWDRALPSPTDINRKGLRCCSAIEQLRQYCVLEFFRDTSTARPEPCRFDLGFCGTGWSLESNPPIAGRRRRHEFAQGVDDVLNIVSMLVQATFEFGKFRQDVPI